jgi:transcriptional regulator with XRE-family HTH domain
VLNLLKSVETCLHINYSLASEEMMVADARKHGFAKRVGRLREELELTQAELGRKVGVSGTCVWNWESANTYPRSTNTMRRLAQALATTVEFLSAGEEPRENQSRASNGQRSIADIILEARQKVAAAAGLSVDNVRVVLDWSD